MDLKAMDLSEVRNLVKWLDEQQRKSRQELAGVQQQAAGQERKVSELVRRVQELEQQASATQAWVARLASFDERLDHFKAEMVHLVEQYDDKRAKSEKEMERLRQVEHSAHARLLAEIQGEVATIPRLSESMDGVRAESERLSAAVTTLQNELLLTSDRLDERVRDVAYLEEARSQDARRIADLQQEGVDSRKRADDLQAKHLVLEDVMRRNEARIDRLRQTELERKQEVDRFLEQGKLADQQRKIDLAAWSKQLEEFKELMAGYARQWRQFEEQYRAMKAATDDLEDFEARLDRRQTEANEASRLEDERMKQQWTEFLAEYDKLTKQRATEDDQRAKVQQRQREELMEQLNALQEQASQASEDIKALFGLQDKTIDNFRQITRSLMEAYESAIKSPPTRRIPG